MNIAEVQHAVCYTIFKDGKVILSKEFNGFMALNSFLEEASQEPFYQECEAQLFLAEIADGVRNGASLIHTESQVKPISFNRALEILRYARQDIVEKRYCPEAKGPASIADLELEGAPSTTKGTAADMTYVCPRCIYELHECACEYRPSTLIQLDKKMVPIIRNLKAKGYETTHSCAGHKSDTPRGLSTYIAFAEAYPFFSLPEPLVYYRGSGVVRSRYHGDAIPSELFQDYQDEAIDALLKWSEEVYKNPKYFMPEIAELEIEVRFDCDQEDGASDEDFGR